MPSHHDMQSAFRAALTDQSVPKGVTATGDVAKRFSVYRNTVMHSLSDALAQRFPVIRRIVGDAFFTATAKVFVTEYPPKTPMIHEYGADFPQFLVEFPPAATLPYLHDVAVLELARGHAYHAPDADPFSAQDFAKAVEGDPERAIVMLHPSLRVVASGYPVVSIWQQNQPDATRQDIAPRPEAALIFRAGHDAVIWPASARTAAIIQSMSQGRPLGGVTPDDAPQALADTLTFLLRHDLIIGVILS